MPKSSLLFFLQALGSFYFIHESLRNVLQFDFKGEATSPPLIYILTHRCPEMKPSPNRAPLIPRLHIARRHPQAIAASIKSSEPRLAPRIM